MKKTPFLPLAGLLAAAALFGAAIGHAQQPSRVERMDPPGATGQSFVQAQQPQRPVAAPAPRQEPGGLRSAGAASQPRATNSTSGQTARRVDPPAKFGPGVAALNQERASAGLAPVIWSAAREEEARKAVEAAVGVRFCTRSSSAKVGTQADAAVYWGASTRMLDGGSEAQDLSAAYVVSEWLREKSSYDPSSGCSRRGACEAYSRIVKPTARTVGCAVAFCADRSQVWACRFGD